jgi:hypothetical protein
MIRALVAVFMAALLSGCATIVAGTSQDIAIDSDPQGARCVLSQNGQQVTIIDKTPATVKVKKSESALGVRCEKDGYEAGTASLESDIAAEAFGNILIGGVIGAMIDSSSGASRKYDGQIVVALAPKTDAAVARKEPDAPAVEPVAATVTSGMMPKPEPVAETIVADAATVQPAAATSEAMPKAEPAVETVAAQSNSTQPIVLADQAPPAAKPAAPAERAQASAPKRAGVPADLDPMDRSAHIVKFGYTYATPSDQTAGLSALKVGMEIHVDGKVPGKDWYYVSGPEEARLRQGGSAHLGR